MPLLMGKKVLITSGPTWVAVDDVRVLSNRSTGELGRVMATRLRAAGAEVTVLEGPVIEPLKDRGIRVLKFSYFDELAELLNQELKKRYDVVIHAAAVSDFQLEKKFAGKISSEKKRLTLNLVRTPKLINRIKKLCPKAFLVGFKLESDFSKLSVIKEAQKLFSLGKCDIVVANFFGQKGYEAFILDKKRTLLGKVTTRAELTAALVAVLKSKL